MKKQKDYVFTKTHDRIIEIISAMLALLILSGCAHSGKIGERTNTVSHSDSEAALSSLDTIEPPVYVGSGSEWYDDYAIVAHALGTVVGRVETNCREAFIESYGNGQRVFEADFTLTSDEHLVVRHDFLDISYYNLEQEPGENYVMDYETYMASKIKLIYTPLDVYGLLALLTEYSDAYLITDSKNTDVETVTKEFEIFAQAVRDTDEALFDRIIVQLYNDEMYDAVSSVFPCGGYIYTLYQIADPDYNAIGKFCAERGVAVVTMSYERMSPDTCAILHSYGLKVYLHTVNRMAQMKYWHSVGADGFYCDYVTQTDWEKALGGT